MFTREIDTDGAAKVINKGDELFLAYGDKYWGDKDRQSK
jgi:hypothetical protein